MIIDYDGQKYSFDMDDITVKQGLRIEKFMGCSFTEWGKRLQTGDLLARQVLGWLILNPDGAIEDTDFKMVKLGAALDAAYAAEAQAAGEGEPVPTVAVSNGQMPEGSSPESLEPFSGAI